MKNWYRSKNLYVRKNILFCKIFENQFLNMKSSKIDKLQWGYDFRPTSKAYNSGMQYLNETFNATIR